MPLTDLSFMVHYDSGPLVIDYLDDITANEPDWRVGSTIFLPRWRATTHQDKVDQLAPVSDFVLADPDTRRMLLPFDKRGRGRDDFAYLANSDPAANRNRFVRDVL